MKTKKSAKDLAFDKERTNYRHKITDLNRKINESANEIRELNHKISELQESIRQKDDWIHRLLEYTELTEENMRNQIQKDKSVSEVINHIEEMNNMILGFGRKFGF